jgi:hypothetical protein
MKDAAFKRLGLAAGPRNDKCFEMAVEMVAFGGTNPTLPHLVETMRVFVESKTFWRSLEGVDVTQKCPPK